MSPDLIAQYTTGECHIHAIAAQRLHGGGFVIAYDHSDPYYEDDEGGDVPTVIHVWSSHEMPDGSWIMRDIHGDVPLTEESAKEALIRAFPDYETEMEFGDITIDLKCTLMEVEDLSGDEDHQPLYPIEEADILAALELESVLASPGARPAKWPDNMSQTPDCP